MVITLRYRQDVTREIFFDDVPRGFSMVGQAPYTESLSLPYRVVHQAAMLTQYPAIQIFDPAGLGRQVLLQKVRKSPLTDKADTGRILFPCIRQTSPFG